MNEQMQAAEQLIIDKLTGNISEADDLLLAGMLEKDEDLKKLYQQTLLTFTAWKQNVHSDRDEAWKKMSASLGAHLSGDSVRHEEEDRKRPPVRRIKPWMAAASIALLLMAGSLIYFVANRTDSKAVAQKPVIELKLSNGQTVEIDKNKPATIQLDNLTLNYDSAGVRYSLNDKTLAEQISTISVPQGFDYHLVLDDGSEAWLNAATELRFPMRFTGNRREVVLKGEAFFKVAKNTQKPFIVTTADMSVMVTGTSFNVKAYPGEGIQTSLVEGKVTASSKAAERALTPGTAAWLNNKGELITGDFDEEMILAWMRGYYFFKDEPITAINPTLHRWFGYNFQYDDPSIAHIHFSGAMEKNQSLQTFLRRLASSAGLSYRIEAKDVILSRK